MPPPELPADGPIAFFTKPIDIALGVTFGNDFEPAVGHSIDSRLCQFVHLDKPLVHQKRLDGRLRAVAVGQINFAVLDFHHQTGRFQISHDRVSGLLNNKAAILLRHAVVERAVGTEYVDRTDVEMPLPDVIVVLIVARA